MHDKVTAVFGASGFLGRYAVGALAGHGWRVRAAGRRPYLAGHLQTMGDVGQIHAVQANVRYASSVAGPVEGTEAVVNLAGISTQSAGQTFQDVNVDGARAVARAAHKAGVKTLIHISTLCAHSKSASQYGRSKAEGETVVLEEFADAIIFRPSLMFGAEDRLFNRVAAFTRLSPLIPLIGGGQAKVQLVTLEMSQRRLLLHAEVWRCRVRFMSWEAPTSSAVVSSSATRWHGRVAGGGMCRYHTGLPRSVWLRLRRYQVGCAYYRSTKWQCFIDRVS